ncbi:colicin transporter, partial [Bifidobacterium longum]
TYRGTTSGGSGPAAASAPKPNLNGSYGCTEDCYVPPNNLIQH